MVLPFAVHASSANDLALVAVLTLAVGISSNTAIFTVADHVLLQAWAVSKGYFAALGVTPQLGRAFTAEEYRSNARRR